MRSLFVLAVLVVALPAHAGTIMINNGLAPPNPANVIDDATYATDDVYVRNAECPPGWPVAGPEDPCPSPGDPTEVSIAPGPSSSVATSVTVFDSSTIMMSSGIIYSTLSTYGNSAVNMSGGTVVFDGMRTHDSSTFIMTGGAVNSLYAYGSSTATLGGGAVADGWLRSHDAASVTVTDGRVVRALAYNASGLNISGGLFASLASYHSATIMMSGGQVGDDSWSPSVYVSAFGNSRIFMSGGTVGNVSSESGYLSARDSATFTLSGGMLIGNSWIYASDASLFRIVGTGFTVDGNPVPYGNLTELTGVLRGTLASGDSLNTAFLRGWLGSPGTIQLVPEPSTALMLGGGLVGLLALMRRVAAQRSRRVR